MIALIAMVTIAELLIGEAAVGGASLDADTAGARLNILIPGFDAEPFAHSESLNVMTLRREPQTAPTLFPRADSQVSNC